VLTHSCTHVLLVEVKRHEMDRLYCIIVSTRRSLIIAPEGRSQRAKLTHTYSHTVEVDSSRRAVQSSGAECSCCAAKGQYVACREQELEHAVGNCSNTWASEN
jgi:hypothetical protein